VNRSRGQERGAVTAGLSRPRRHLPVRPPRDGAITAPA
jgi:hypothetical protein